MTTVIQNRLKEQSKICDTRELFPASIKSISRNAGHFHNRGQQNRTSLHSQIGNSQILTFSKNTFQKMIKFWLLLEVPFILFSERKTSGL